jgi:acyl-CoA synthetase (AMP-forming)/AMP-acid ligase II
VAQVAVIGVPDERMGEVGCAYIVSSPDVDDTLAQSLMRWARNAMANYKVPRQVVLVDALPLNAGGKVLKRELRQRHAAGQDHVVTYERSN